MTYCYNYIWGTHGDDNIQGTHGNDVIFGGDGDDKIYGGNGRDYIYAGKGNDFIIGGFGLDYIHGGQGNDTISWDNLSSGLSVDLYSQTVHFTVGGGEHFSSIENIVGSRGNDTIKGDHGSNILNGNKGNDLLIGRGGNDVLVGEEGNDRMYGGSGNDTFIGGEGNDKSFGGSGFDFFIGGEGNDFIDGGSHLLDKVDYSELDVRVSIQAGGVVHKEGVGTDHVRNVEEFIGSANYANVIDGRDATGHASLDVDFSQDTFTVKNVPHVGDLTYTVRNFSEVRGTEENDVMKGGDGRDFFYGNGGNDTLEGGAGDDDLFGGEGDDVIIGGLGKDFMIGGGGNDILTSLEATDFLNGTDAEHAGAGELDILIGGAEGDRFVLGDATRAYYTAEGFSDFAGITDFGINEDVIVLHGSANDYTLQTNNGEVSISYGNERIGIVAGANVANLSLNSNNFEYVA
ncbi:MAG: calcium-binding protein [Phormidesmis sp.]